jgi:molybdenum cofactor biosynthesis protein B
MTTLPVGPTPRPLKLAILTVSDTRTLETDTSGQRLVEFAARAGHQVIQRRIVTDDLETIREQVQQWSQTSSIEVVLITGGTGIAERDVTPEAVEPLLSRTIPGFGELFRMLSYEDIGAATIQSRAFAGLVGTTLVFALPGSSGAVGLAIDRILLPQFDVRTKPCNFAQHLARLSESTRP